MLNDFLLYLFAGVNGECKIAYEREMIAIIIIIIFFWAVGICLKIQVKFKRQKLLRSALTCSCSGFFVPFSIARHAAELALQLSPYCGKSGLQTFK